MGSGTGGDGLYACVSTQTAQAVANRLLTTDFNRVFPVIKKKVAKSYECCLISPFAGKDYCFKDYLKSLSRLPTKEMFGIIYDNSNSEKFGKKLKNILPEFFKDYVYIVDENRQFTVENTSEYGLISRRCAEIYGITTRFVPRSKYTFILEDDVLIPEGTYKKFHTLMETYPEVGTVVGNCNNRRNPGVVSPNGYGVPIAWNFVEKKEIPSGKITVESYFIPEKKYGIEAIGSAHTGCWMSRSHLLKKYRLNIQFINGIWAQDRVWGYMINKAGWKMMMDWSVKCKHYLKLNGKKVYV